MGLFNVVFDKESNAVAWTVSEIQTKDMKLNFFTITVAKSQRSCPKVANINLDQLVRSTTSARTIWLVNWSISLVDWNLGPRKIKTKTLGTWSSHHNVIYVYYCIIQSQFKAKVSKVFARRPTCGEMNICGAAFDYNTGILVVGRILLILWIKPRKPVMICSRAAFGLQDRLWTCLV